MSNKIKTYIIENILCKIKTFREYKDWDILHSSMLGTLAVNFVFQRILGINGKCKYPVHYTSRITNAAKLVIKGNGKRTVLCMAVNGGCYLQASNGIVIEEGVLIAPGVKIVSGNHDLYDLDKPATGTPPIIIGKNVWIGANAVILPGVTIAEESIIGAGAIVTKSISVPGSIVAGNPAKVLGNKFDKDRVVNNVKS